MTRRQTPARPDLRDRWSFDDDAPVAPQARRNEPPQARFDDAPTARRDDTPQARNNDEWAQGRLDDTPQTRNEAMPDARHDDSPYEPPVERDLLFQPAPETVRPAAPAETARPAKPMPQPQAARFGPRPTQEASPSPWTTIQVSEKARARAAAAGLHRYVEEKRSSSRASWLVVSAIVLLTIGAAVGLYRLADPQAPALTQSAETPFGEPQSDRPSAAIEVPPQSPAKTAPARQAPPGPGSGTPSLDAPMIEVAP